MQMTILCANNTHIYRVGSTRCDCGAQANNPPVAGYPFPPNYNPHHPRMQPPVAAPEIPAHVKRAATEAGASHLSVDGSKAYMVRFGLFYYAKWDGARFGSWFLEGENLPCGVVSVE